MSFLQKRKPVSAIAENGLSKTFLDVCTNTNSGLSHRNQVAVIIAGRYQLTPQMANLVCGLQNYGGAAHG